MTEQQMTDLLKSIRLRVIQASVAMDDGYRPTNEQKKLIRQITAIVNS